MLYKPHNCRTDYPSFVKNTFKRCGLKQKKIQKRDDNRILQDSVELVKFRDKRRIQQFSRNRGKPTALQIVHGDQTRWKENFYKADHVTDQRFVTQMLTRDLFAVANFVM